MQAIFTIGHSNRTIEEFIGLLSDQRIDLLIDIRTVPKSRANPQFGQDLLPPVLAAAGIAYEYIAALGGLRHARKDSPNSGWRNKSFRGYADHMQSDEFNAGVDVVLVRAADRRCALMCAEAVPWRCHRSMVADALAVRGIPAEHIINRGKTRPHVLTSFARVDGVRIAYPPPDAEGEPGGEAPCC
ncbi:DUF488 domain-containing protein [Pseudoduganella chitinolytica]|uniref:DUF488 domain-containing protein n=1 Tax=Pseudoduganella chitinolytica TaxID=34070 RepID=A0ABY8B8M2_9BURK|nr:DUF488 domain-containing protein [Pseudoduganella chitinolytica]WEF31368.1 DUF488 domain-containing protein [Pseudoduganella chitinolytica]